MTSPLPWYPSPRGGRSLAELLEEQQEPFLLEVYLMENGCSGRMMTSQSKPFCWPLNLRRRLRIRPSSQGGTTAAFLKRTLTKFIYSNTATIEHRRLSFSSCFSEESKHQLSPVFVLELHSADSSLFHNHVKNECRSTPRMDSLNKAYKTFEAVHENSKPHNYTEKTSKFSKGRIRIRPALDCVKEAKERIWNFYGTFSSTEMLKKAMNEIILSNERHKGDVNNLASDFSSWKEEWNQFKPPLVREIGLLIEAAIFDDLREEAVLDMLVLH